ncbi:MAG: hypothetical protein ACJAVV_000889 [Alphaproteobacteria bacterium]|jgi:hypothetical protein
MNVIIRTILLIGFFGQSFAFAHEGHDVISSEKALNIANTSVKQLTFKDLGFEIGKLDATWKSLSDSNFSVIQILDETFIISATNVINNDVIYFEIAKDGKVLGVKDSN